MGAAAFAASTAATGMINAIDAKAMTVTLEDGTIYLLPAGFKIDTFKVGEKVALTSQMKGTDKLVDTLKAE